MRGLLLAVAAALAALPLRHLLTSLRLPRSCDTTYVWEGYEEVALSTPHPRFRLITYRDGDRTLRRGEHHYRESVELHGQG